MGRRNWRLTSHQAADLGLRVFGSEGSVESFACFPKLGATLPTWALKGGQISTASTETKRQLIYSFTSSVFKEIDSGERIALAKLAAEHLAATGRPLRVAIDVSIWQFQVQAGQGGTNPALRTFFYRLVRLHSLAITAVFVFDGPKRPAWKRNKRVGGAHGAGGFATVADVMARRLVTLFGFYVHKAPGEAEAECAFLQRNGVVDVVLSEDVDTLMFGATRLIRKWSAEMGGYTPTHVTLHEAARMKTDREGLVLIALMSGGDYDTGGVRNCGVKVALEAARAGFGTRLCRIKTSDSDRDCGSDPFESWRNDLKRELESNSMKFFSRKNKAISAAIGPEFPNIQVLKYYTHPVVSPITVIDTLKESLDRPRPRIQVEDLRQFVSDHFDWTYRAGALKFVKVLSPAVLVHKLLMQPDPHDKHSDSKLGLISDKAITRTREHASTGMLLEYRVSYIPTNVVGCDPYQEEEEEVEADRVGLATNSDDDFDDAGEEGNGRALSNFKASEPNLAWIPQLILKKGVPALVKQWEDAKTAKANKVAAKKTVKTKAAPKVKRVDSGPLDQYFASSQEARAAVQVAQPPTSKPTSTKNRASTAKATIQSSLTLKISKTDTQAKTKPDLDSSQRSRPRVNPSKTFPLSSSPAAVTSPSRRKLLIEPEPISTIPPARRQRDTAAAKQTDVSKPKTKPSPRKVFQQASLKSYMTQASKSGFDHGSSSKACIDNEKPESKQWAAAYTGTQTFDEFGYASVESDDDGDVFITSFDAKLRASQTKPECGPSPIYSFVLPPSFLPPHPQTKKQAPQARMKLQQHHSAPADVILISSSPSVRSPSALSKPALALPSTRPCTPQLSPRPPKLKTESAPPTVPPPSGRPYPDDEFDENADLAHLPSLDELFPRAQYHNQRRSSSPPPPLSNSSPRSPSKRSCLMTHLDNDDSNVINHNSTCPNPNDSDAIIDAPGSPPQHHEQRRSSASPPSPEFPLTHKRLRARSRDVGRITQLYIAAAASDSSVGGEGIGEFSGRKGAKGGSQKAGYLKTLQVPAEQADEERTRLEKMGRQVWRRSDVYFVDLTEES